MRSRSSSFSFSSSNEGAAAGLLLALLVLFLFYPAVGGGRVWLPAPLMAHVYPFRAVATEMPPPWNPLMWDGMAQFGVWRLYTAKMWREGWLPLWNPHQGMGYPLYANSQSAIFYPPNALFAWFDAKAFGWLAVLHLWWAAMGTWLLLRRQMAVCFTSALVGAVVFAFSLWMVAWQYLPTLPATASWVPWVALTASAWVRQPGVRTATWWGATMGFCLLAGHLQIAFYALAAGGLLVVVSALRRDVSSNFRVQKGVVAASLLMAFALAVALSAPQVLPAVELSRYSHRRAPATAEGYSAYVGSAMPFAHLITLFLPDFFGHPSVPRADAPDVSTYWGRGNYAEFACFVGIPALLLAAIGIGVRRSGARWYALALALLAMLLALGTPLNTLLYFGVPGFSSTGSPARVLVLWAFGVALLAAIGTERLINEGSPLRHWLLAVGTLAALFIASLLSARAVAQDMLGTEAFVDIVRAQLPVLLQGITLAAIGVGVLLAGQRRSWNALLSGGVLLLCVVGSLAMAGVDYNPTASSEKVYPDTALIERARVLTEGGGRIFAVQSGWSLYRAPEAILPPNLATVFGLYDLQIYDSLMPLHAKRWLDALNGRDSAPVENGNMALGWRAPVERLAAVGVKVVLSLRPLSPNGLLLMEDTPEGIMYEVVGARSWLRTADGRACAFRWQGCNRLQVSLPSGTNTLHVFQTFYPGWKVEPKGRIDLLDSTFQRVEVEPAVRSVTLRFAPDLLRVCLYFALLAVAWLGCQGVLTVTNGRM